MKFEPTFSLVKLSESSMQKCLHEKKAVEKTLGKTKLTPGLREAKNEVNVILLMQLFNITWKEKTCRQFFPKT